MAGCWHHFIVETGREACGFRADQRSMAGGGHWCKVMHASALRTLVARNWRGETGRFISGLIASVTGARRRGCRATVPVLPWWWRSCAGRKKAMRGGLGQCWAFRVGRLARSVGKLSLVGFSLVAWAGLTREEGSWVAGRKEEGRPKGERRGREVGCVAGPREEEGIRPEKKQQPIAVHRLLNKYGR